MTSHVAIAYYSLEGVKLKGYVEKIGTEEALKRDFGLV